MKIASGKDLDARLSNPSKIVAEQLALELQIDQVPEAVVGPSLGLLGDGVELLGHLIAQGEARNALGTVELEVGDADRHRDEFGFDALGHATSICRVCQSLPAKLTCTNRRRLPVSRMSSTGPLRRNEKLP